MQVRRSCVMSSNAITEPVNAIRRVHRVCEGAGAWSSASPEPASTSHLVQIVNYINPMPYSCEREARRARKPSSHRSYASGRRHPEPTAHGGARLDPAGCDRNRHRAGVPFLLGSSTSLLSLRGAYWKKYPPPFQSPPSVWKKIPGAVFRTSKFGI